MKQVSTFLLNFLQILLFVFIFSNLKTNAQIPGAFYWNSTSSNSYQLGLNWKVWDGATFVATIPPPASPTSTVIIDFTGVNTNTINLDLGGSGSLQIKEIYFINNDPTPCYVNFTTTTNLDVSHTFSVSGTGASLIKFSATTPGEGSTLHGDKVIVFTPPISTTISPIFAGSTFSNVSMHVNGRGTTNISEDVVVYSFYHRLGYFNTISNTITCESTFAIDSEFPTNIGFADLSGSVINTNFMFLTTNAAYSLSAATTTINFNQTKATNATRDGFSDIILKGDNLGSTCTIGEINATGPEPLYFSTSTTINCSKNIIFNTVSSNLDLYFAGTTETGTDFRIVNLKLMKPLTMWGLGLSTIKDVASIFTAPTSCQAPYHFISNTDRQKIQTTGLISVNGLSCKNINVTSGSISSSNAVNMGHNTGITFISPIPSSSYGATTLTWTGNANNSWSNPLNWAPLGCVPNILTNVIIPSGATNPLILNDGGAVCYDFTTTGNPTITCMGMANITIGGDFTRSNGTVIFSPFAYSKTINLLGLNPSNTYSITSNSGNLLSYGVNINTTGSKYLLMDDFSVDYPSTFNRNRLQVISGKFVSQGQSIFANAFHIGATESSINTRSVDISSTPTYTNPIIILDKYNAGSDYSSFYLDCNNTMEFVTSGSNIYISQNGFYDSNDDLYIVNLPANNQTAVPSFNFNRVVFLTHPLRVPKISFASLGANTTYLSGVHFQSIKIDGYLDINSTSSGRNLLNVDTLIVKSGYTLRGVANNSVTINHKIVSTTNCLLGRFNLTSLTPGTSSTNQFYVNAPLTGTYTALTYTLSEWNIDAVKVNQASGGSPQIYVNNAYLTPNTGISPANGWITTAVTPRVFYWIGEGASTNWTDVDNWSYAVPTATDDPTAGCLPNEFDDVIFTNLSFYGLGGLTTFSTNLVTVNNNVKFKDMRWNGPFTTTSTGTVPLYPQIVPTTSNTVMDAYGSIFMHKTMNWNFGTDILNENFVFFRSTSADTIEIQNQSFKSNIYFEGAGNYLVLDSLVLSNANATSVNNNFQGIVVQNNGSLDVSTKKWFGKGYQNTSSVLKPVKLDISNSKVTFYPSRFLNVLDGAGGSSGITFANTSANTYTLNAINSLINLRLISNYRMISKNHDVQMSISNPTISAGPNFNFSTIKITSINTAADFYKINVVGKGVNIDSLVFDVDNTEFINTVRTQTNTINYLKYKLGSTNVLTSGATTLLKELDSRAFCLPTLIKSDIVGSFSNLCPSSASGTLSATDNQLEYINSACGTYVSPNYSLVKGPNSSFKPLGTENTYGWTVNTGAVALGFIPINSATVNCNQLPHIIGTSGFNASVLSHTYTWSTPSGTLLGTPTNSINASTYNATAGGVYTLQIAYSSACQLIDTYTVNLINNINSALTSTNITCNGANNGSALITPSPSTLSTGAYTYSISPGSYTTASVSAFAPGVYTYTVANPLNPSTCKSVNTFTITQPAAVSSTLSVNNVLCYGNTTGSISAIGGGGTAGYSYSLTAPTSTTPIVNTTGNFTGLNPTTPSAVYTVVTTDSRNCPVSTNTIVLSQPSMALTSTINSISNVLCYGANTGSASILGIGGTGVLTYSWSPGSITTSTVTGLGANVYSVTVTDANGCATTKTLSITQPTSGLSISSLTTNSVLCYGTNSGSVSLTAIGGTPSYTTNWSGPSSYTATTTGLTNSIPASAGTYSATITDANGCTTSTTALISEPTASVSVALTGSVSPTNCTGNTGIANVSSSGGTGSGYVYTWVNSAGTNTTAVTTNTALPLGTTTVIINDGNGCASNAIILNVSSLGAPTVAVTTNSILCNGGNGSAVANVIGTAPYSYTWQASSSVTNNSGSLSAGIYSVVVNETSTGCKTIETFTLSEPTALASLISNIVNVPCFGGSNGSASVTATGGTSTYSYNWLPSGGSASTGTNLAQGLYTVTVTDNNNCTKTNTVEILGISEDINISITDTVKPDCGNYTNGSISIGVTGGTPSYTYLWNNGITTPNNLNITSATYMVTVTDANNCNKQLEITLDCYTALLIPEIFSPNGDGKNDMFEIKGIYAYPNNKIMIFNRWGSLVYQKERYNNEWDGKPNVNTGTGKELLPSGTYYVIFDFGDNGKTKTYNGFVQLEY